jgi:hypothetical protein
MSSITESTPTHIIKSDRTGRTRYTRQYKQEVLAAFESSSLSAPVFAAQCGIKYPTFSSREIAALLLPVLEALQTLAQALDSELLPGVPARKRPKPAMADTACS